MPSKVERWLAAKAKKQEGTATDKIRADRAIDSGSEEFRVGAELDRYVGKASALAPYSPAPTTAEQPTYVEQTPLERKEQKLVSAARQRAEKRKTAGDDYYKKEYGMTKAEYDKEYDAIDRMSAVREARSNMQEIEDTAKARTEEKVALAPLVKEYKDAFIGILPESAYAGYSPVGDKEEIKEDIVLNYLMTLPAEERYAQLEKAAYRSTIVPRIEALKEKATQFMNEEAERIIEMQKHVPVPGYAGAAGMQLGASGTWESPVEYLEDLYTSVKKDDFKSGFVEAADWRDFISFGLASLGGDAAKLQALHKAYKGEPLTEQDKFFIEVAEIEQALEDFRTEKGGASFWNSLGSGAAHSSQFMTEMLMTGGLGGAAKVATGGIKQAFKQGVGRGFAHLAFKNLPKTIAYGAKRSPLMGGIYRNLMDRRINQYSVANGQVDLTNPESLWKSIGVAWVDQTFEIASELWGNMLHLGFGKIGKAIGADKWLKPKSVNLKPTPAVRRVLRDGLLWSGDIPSEMTSEFLGDVATNLAYSAFNKDERYWGGLFTRDYWYNLIALTAGLKAGVTVASLPSIVASNKKVKQLEARSAESFNAIGNEELKNKVLNLGGRTDIEDVAEYMHSIDWSQYKPIEVAHAIDYMMSEVERQVVAGSESEQERAERYAPRLARIQELAYLNAEGVAMPTMITAEANFGVDNTQGVTILEGDYNNPEAMVRVRLADGTTDVVLGEKLSNVVETDMASLVAEDYAMTFAEEDAMETLGEVEQTLFDMQRTGASNTQQIRAVEKAGLTVFNEGEVVTLLNGEEATVVEGFRHGLYTVMRADGSLSIVGVGGILQPDVAMAQAQRSVAMPQEQTPLTQSAPLPEDIDTTTDYATPDGFVGKAVDYNAESDQVTLQSADGGLTNVPRASLTVANAEQVAPQEDITENLATETISEMEQSEAEEAPMPVAPQTAPIPQNEDGSVDYESITDATMYANAIESDMGNAETAMAEVAEVRQSKEAELAKLQEQKKQTANMNEKVALRQQEQKLVQQIAMLNEVESILGSRATAVEAETAQVNEAVETAPIAEDVYLDKQGNPINANGALIAEPINSIDDITDEDFTEPYRNIILPPIPKKTDDALGANGKPIVIKKNIFERNLIRHSDLSPQQSRNILKSALYSPNLYGQNQKTKKPYNWVVVSVADANGQNRLVLLEISDKKDNVEIVHWHFVDNRGLEKLKKQAEREGGQLLILPSESSEEVGALSDLTLSSSENKDTNSVPNVQELEQKNNTITIAENAGIKENDFAKQLRNENPAEYNTFNALAKLLGLEIEFVESAGEGNALIVGNKMQVAYNPANREETLRFLIGHESLHRLKQIAPEAYAELMEDVKAHLGEELFGQRVERLRVRYEHQGIAITEESLEEEVVADFIGEMEEDYNVVSDLATQNPNKSWWQKLIEGLRNLFSFLEEAEADTTKVASILNKIETAYKAAAEKVQTLEVETVNGEVSAEEADVRYSIKEEDTSAIMNSAKEEFEATDDWGVTGWLLPDGTQLSFAEEESFERDIDHRAIGLAYIGTPDERWQYLQDFERRGGIRISANYGEGTIEMMVAPTPEQMRKISSFSRYASGNISIDFMDDNYNTVHSVYYENANPSRISADIDRYFDEGIKPTGNVRFSLKDDNAIDNLHKASNTIRKWVENDVRGKSFRIELPEYVTRQIRREMGRDFDSHNITANGIAHALKNHGENGKKLTEKSIPIRKEDAELIPYIMAAPSYVRKGSTKNNRDSVRYYKTISNGYVVVIEKELDNSVDDLETINMWAELSDVSNAASTTLNRTPETTTISRSDIAKIIKDAETAIENEQKLKYSLKDTFYSNAELAVRNIKQEKATPEQWLKMIEKNGGLKAGEDKWLGLSDWLKEQMRGSIKEKPTTININGTEYNVKELEEQILSDIKAMLGETGFEDELIGIRLVGSYARGEQRPDSDIDVIVEYKGNSTEDTLFNVLNDEEHRINIGGVDVDINPITEGKSGTLDEWEKRNAGFTKKPITLTKDEVLDYIHQNQIQIEEVEYTADAVGFDALKAEYDALLRNEGYDAAHDTMIDRFGDDFDIAFSDLGGELIIENEEAAATLLGSGNIINSTRLGYTTNGLDNHREIALTVPTIEPWNTSDAVHFGDAGDGRAVAWIRFGETTDTEGKRVLVIDEIQSKRHQEGRERGYRSIQLEKEMLLAKEKLAKANRELGDYKSGLKEKYDFKNIKGSFFERHQIFYDALLAEERAQLDTLAEKRNDAEAKWQSSQLKATGIPSAPFEKNWAELAMKRILRYAAENGYDKVAWTTGDQQSERYDLSHMVDYIDAERNVDGTYNINVATTDDSHYVQETNIAENKLSELVGKDIAFGIISSIENSDSNKAHIEADDMTIGGSGMKAFYDQMLPSFMRKYAKKWGATVGEVTMPNLEENNTMHSVDVTPAMRESVMQGQPMFSLRNPEWQSQFGVPLADGKELSLEDVRTLFGSTNSDTLLGEIFDRVYAVMEKLPRKVIKVVEELPDKRNVLGTASTKGDVTFRTVLFKNYGEQAIAETILHELIHSVTTYATHAYAKQATSEKHSKAYDALPAEIKKACRELQSVYNRLSKKNNLKGAYGVKNINEMLAELSNPEFRTLVEEGGFWKVLLNAIKRMFGFEGTYNAELKELDNILSSFLENYNEEAYMDAVESIYGEDIFTTIEEVDAKETDNQGKEVKYSVKEVNNRFNEELQQQIDGTLPQRHIYQLGLPSPIMLACKFPYIPIELSSTNLANHARDPKHPFELLDVKDLVLALQKPIAVFVYGDESKSQNVIIEITKNEKNFLVGIHFNQAHRGMVVSDIRGIFPKDNAEWLNWIQQGKSKYLDKEKLQALINQQRKTLAEVKYLDLDSVTKIIQNFENPKIEPRNSLKSLDAPYLDAVARGDMETAQRMVMEAATIAMPNTKVVDEDGLPKIVEHSTWNDDFYTFDINHLGESSGDEGVYGAGFYFGNVGETELYGDRAIKVYLNLHNPLVLPDAPIKGFFDYLVENFDKEGLRDIVVKQGNNTATMGDVVDAIKSVNEAHAQGEYAELIEQMSQYWMGAEGRVLEQQIFRKIGFAIYPTLEPFIQYNVGRKEFSEALRNAGYDGVVYNNQEYVAFNPNQIKSADVVTYDDAGNIIPLSERFNPEKEDIRYSLREATSEKLTPAMIRHHMMENVTRHHEQEVNRINRFYDREERQAKALAKKARKEVGLVYPKNGKITDRLAFLIPDGKTTLPMELQVTYDIANGLKLKWSDSKDGRKHGLSSELGLGSSRKEGYGAITVGATMYVEDYVAQLMEENSGYSRDLDDNDIRNAVINVLSQYTKPKQAIQALEDIFLSNEMDDAEAEALYKIDLRRQEALEAENARYEGLKASYERNPRAFERDYFEQMEKDVVALNFKEREIRRLKRDIKALRNTHNKTYREQAERIQKVREAIDDFLKSTYGRNISTTEVKRLFDALQKATTQKQLERVIEAVSRMEKRTTDRIEQERKRRLLKMKLSFFIPADAISLEEYLKDENQKASDAAAIIDYYNTENSDPVMNTFRIALKDRYKGKDSSGVSVAKLIDAETAEIMAFISTNATRRDIVEANLAEEAAKLYEAKEKLKGKLPFSQSTMDKIDQAYEVVLDYWEADIKRQGAVSYNKAMRELSIEIEIAKKKRDEAQLAGSDELYELAVAEVAGLMNEARELAESHYDGMGKANKILMEANDAVERLLLGGRRLLSEEREAKRKHDAEVLRDAINDITNYGEEYKELNAKAHDQRKASKDKKPSRLKRIHSKWADSLEYLLNVMAPYAPEGSGLTYQRIIGGALGAASTLYINTKVVNMAVEGAIKRIWGGKMKHNTLPKLLNQSQQIVLAENYVIGYYEETEDGKKVKNPRRWCLTMGNAIYLLAMWEQPDSHYKLTANGVTQEVIDDVTSLIVNKDARWIEFKNWVVDELLPARREVYDETHRKVQGTYMAESKNYFPIHILSQDRHQEEKASEEKAQQRSIKPSGVKQRVYNTNMIDLNVDFVKALMDNLYTMEMWAAIAPVEEDMNVILSNNTAKNLMNAKFGADFSQRLKTAMQVTVGTLTSGYINSTEKFFQDLTRRWGGTKIAFGINTALKQLAGAGAMCVYAIDWRFLWYLAKNIQFLFTPKSAQEFFPMLQKRWEEGLAGNIGLKELFRSDVTTSSGFAIAEENVNRVTTDIVKLGMIPNKIVDMAVCAMMAKSVYEYEYNRYIKQGYSKEMAEKKAMIDAESSYNKTQQSSEMAFLSSGQVSSNILYRSLNIFMNNSIANYRIGVMGIEDIKRGLSRFRKAQRNMRKATERRLFEQYTASGMAEEEARVKAQQEADIIASELSGSSFVAKGFFRSLWGFYFANIVFGFMGIAPYLLFGDDDDKKEELIIDLLKSSAFTPLTLIPTTKAIYETFAYAWKRSEEGRGYQVSIAESLFPMLEDVDQLITNGVGVVADIADGGDMSYAQIYNTIDALLRMGVGVDTNRMLTITDGFIDLGNGDWLEGTLDVLSVPKSQIKLLTGDRKDGETAKEYMTRVMRTMSIVDKNKIDVAELENYNFEVSKWEKPTNISAAEKRKVSEIYRQYQAEYKKDMLKRCSEEVRTDYPEIVEKHAEILKDMGVQDTKLALVKYYEQMVDTLTPEAASALERLAVLQAEISATERSLDLLVSQDGKEYIDLLTEEFNLRKEFVAQYEIYKNLTE